jgi:caffeoyl-CoA O-methyltransferase
MSESSTLVTQQHFDYIAARTGADDDYLQRLKSAARAAGIPPIWIAPEQASLMQILLRAARAKEVLEVGTLAGYSAISMARALPEGGRVRTIEKSEKHADFARRWAAGSDVARKVEVLHGDACQLMPELESNSADAAFLDADKRNYPLYLEQSLRIVRTGGLILVDNAFAFGQLFWDQATDREAPDVKAFNELMAREQRVQAVIVPIGDGLWVGVKR